ncbi:MAG: hypothetical protein AB7S81_04630 [Bdellovibrionales bacterium]
MSFDQCPKCKNFGDLDYHKCPPLFLCLDYDYHGTDWGAARETHAYDAEEAAMNIEQEMGSEGDGPYEGIIHVKSPQGEITAWEITNEPSIEYYATEHEVEELTA